MWSIGVGTVCILVTRVVSFTLVNVYEITDKKKWDFEWININYRYKHFDFYQTAIGTQQLSNSQKPQFICSFLLLVVLWPYFSVKLLFLSSRCSYCIKHSTYEWTTLTYFAMERRRTFMVNKKKVKEYNKKNKQIQIQKTKQKNNKQADKPKQNRTKIYKRASEEYITHAQ